MSSQELYLGSVMQDPSVYIKFPVPIQCFTGWRFDFAKILFKRLSLGEDISSQGIFLEARGQSWWPGFDDVSDMEYYPMKVLAKDYAESLLEGMNRENLSNIAEKIENLLHSGIHSSEIISSVNEELISIHGERKPSIESLENISKVWFDNVKAGNPHIPCVITGEYELDQSWLLDKGGLHIIAGRPGMGKTSFSLWLMAKVAELGVPTLMFSLEMPKSQILNKLYTYWAGTVDEFIGTVVEEKSKLPIYIDDTPAQQIADIMVKAQLHSKTVGVGLVVVDYIQLVRGGSHAQREQEVAFVSASLKELARKLNCPVVALSQLNRAVEATGDKRPTLSNLRESGSIEQDADSVCFLYRPEYYYMLAKKPIPEDQQGVCEFIIGKQRNRKTSTLTSRYLPSRGVFEDWKESVAKVSPQRAAASYSKWGYQED